MNIHTLDEATVEIAAKLHAALLAYGADKARLCYRITPDGSVTASDYWFTRSSGSETKDFPPRELHRLVDGAAEAHWRLTQDTGQPRWYMLTVRIDSAGKYSIEFEHRDDYKEGDIMKELN